MASLYSSENDLRKRIGKKRKKKKTKEVRCTNWIVFLFTNWKTRKKLPPLSCDPRDFSPFSTRLNAGNANLVFSYVSPHFRYFSSPSGRPIWIRNRRNEEFSWNGSSFSPRLKVFLLRFLLLIDPPHPNSSMDSSTAQAKSFAQTEINWDKYDLVSSPPSFFFFFSYPISLIFLMLFWFGVPPILILSVGFLLFHLICIEFVLFMVIDSWDGVFLSSFFQNFWLILCLRGVFGSWIWICLSRLNPCGQGKKLICISNLGDTYGTDAC